VTLERASDRASGRAPAGLELCIVGAGPAYTDRRGATGAAYLVRHGSEAILLDLGQGAFTNLAGLIEPSTLTAVVVSHLHPDHFVDLVSLRHYLRYEFEPPRRMRVVGPAGLGGRLDALHDQPGFAAAALDLEDLAEGTREVGSFRVEARAVRHTADSHAFRVSAGGRPGLVYSGDCGSTEDLAPLIRPGDTLLAEATFGADPVAPGSNHLNAHDLGRLAADAGVAHLLITHVLMGRDRARTLDVASAIAGAPVALVDPGDRFEL
jgi:ribonuclease BN (tRNA processing enzyme)